MEEYEMRYHWDDKEEAKWRKTETHRQDGFLKTWKLERETDEEYQKRTRELVQRKIEFLRDIKLYFVGKFAEIDSQKFR